MHELSHETMGLSVEHEVIIQMRMRSQPVGADVRLLLEHSSESL